MTAKYLVPFFSAWYELRSPESEKRKLWKKSQEGAADKTESSNNTKHEDSQKIQSAIDLFGESKGLSLDNLYDSIKSKMTKEERTSYEESRLKSKSDTVMTGYRPSLRTNAESFLSD